MVFGFIYQSFLIHPLTQMVLTSYRAMIFLISALAWFIASSADNSPLLAFER
jgi:hypothetical protein